MIGDSQDQLADSLCTLQPDETEPSETTAWRTSLPTTVMRIENGASSEYVDYVVEEVPIALVYNGISHAVMLASPDRLEEFALGFSLSEGILAHPAELYDIDILTNEQGIEVHMEIASRRFVALKELRRSLAGRTGCGLCGVEHLNTVVRTFAPVARGAPLSLTAISSALATLPALQPTYGNRRSTRRGMGGRRHRADRISLRRRGSTQRARQTHWFAGACRHRAKERLRSHFQPRQL